MKLTRVNTRILAQGWILPMLLAAALPAAASSFSIAPIRVEMTPSQARGVLTLHNDSEAPVTVQVSGVAWSQAAGEDRYTATHDLLTTPPVFVVPANSEQIVRVALRRESDPGRELAYRLFFEEVPSETTTTFNGLRVALRIGVPVFVAPPSGATPTVTWQAHTAADGTLQIEASNTGSAHLQVTDFELRIGARTEPVHVAGSKYVLPGSSVSWSVHLPAGADPQASLRIHAFTDHGEISADVAHAAR